MLKKWLVALVVIASPGMAQESASFKLTEHTLNGGGHPHRGIVLSSPGFRASLDSIGEGVSSLSPASAGYRITGGFASAYAPAPELAGLRFSGAETLQWDPHAAAASYNLYRESLAGLTGGVPTTCNEWQSVMPTATDSEAPPSGEGWFYLVTATDRLSEEGSRGFESDGTERQGATCQ